MSLRLSDGLQNTLEFELRLQQFIELRRKGRLLEARQHAQKFISPSIENNNPEVHRAAGLLAYSPQTRAEPYRVRAQMPLLCSWYEADPV